MSEPPPPPPGMTLGSLLATVVALLVMAMAVQYSEILVRAHEPAEQVLSAPAMAVILVVLLTAGAFQLATRRRLIGRPQLLLMLYALLCAAPLMTQGFWHRIVGISTTIPRGGQGNIDAMSDKLWPHGPNLLAGRLAQGALAERAAFVAPASGRLLPAAALTNDADDQDCWIRFEVPLRAPGRDEILPGDPYLVNVLARTVKLSPHASYSIAVRDDAGTEDRCFASSDAHTKPNYLHRDGSERVGAYGVRIPTSARERVTIEFALHGAGTVEFADPNLQSVAALVDAYKGKSVVSQAGYDRVKPSERAGLIVRPDHLLSGAGVRYLLGGYIPWAEWRQPILAWTAFLLLLMGSTYAMAAVMRRQWVDKERLGLPLTRIPLALIGRPGEIGAFSEIWRNRAMWVGFAVGLAWCLLRVWHQYDPKVPDANIDIPLKPFFTDPGWGKMWETSFTVNATFLSLAVMIELNILLSLVLGMWMFRSLLWIGEATGAVSNPEYPFMFEQQIGSYLAYAMIILFFARKHLVQVVRQAIRGVGDPGEALSPRAALILLAACIAGGGLWAMWTGMSVGGFLAFFVFLLLVGLVSAKLRAECGTPYAFFAPYSATLLFTLLGGITVFGGNAVLFCYIVCFFLAAEMFYIPGAQLELMELGRGFRIPPRHIAATCLLGIVGGVVFGGWVFLSNCYSLGGEKLPANGWCLANFSWYFGSYNTQMTAASAAVAGAPAEAAGKGIDPHLWGYLGSAGATGLVAVLRQLFAGFWLHPAGIVLSSSFMMLGWGYYLWGSMLVAWAIRLVTLKLGGAETVRTKLQPFFIGVFLATIATYVLVTIHGGVLLNQGTPNTFSETP